MMQIAFQGVAGAYSERAALQFFSRTVINCRAFPDFQSVYRAVMRGEVKFGVLPIENSLTGSIHQNYDLLLKNKVTIVGEVKLKITHCLLTLRKVKLAEVREIYSHPQALLQCAAFIRSLGNVASTPYFDTAGSARFVSESSRRDIAAIASASAAKEYGLTVAKTDIADHFHNYTRFIVVTREGGRQKIAASVKNRGKTSIVFSLKSLPGALYKALSVFAVRDIDLLKIESRPIAGKPWQYLFYLDFVTPKDPHAGKRAVEHLGELTAFLRVLGSYTAAR